MRTGQFDDFSSQRARSQGSEGIVNLFLFSVNISMYYHIGRYLAQGQQGT